MSEMAFYEKVIKVKADVAALLVCYLFVCLRFARQFYCSCVSWFFHFSCS